MRRRRSLIGTAARTAVIAGTATHVSGRVARSQDAAHRAAADGSRDHIEQLERLSRLHDSGALSDAEFRKEKTKLIG
jgi:hypothetical protein